MKVALVYDRVNKWGGAERVLLALHELFPDAPLYTSIYDKRKAGWAKSFDIRTSFLQKIPFVRNNNELFPFLMPLAFESFSFDDYDLVISITSEAAKGVITKPGTMHICYCLTPTRYLWSGYKEYFQSNTLKFFSKPFVSYLRKWDKIASSRPDEFIAISQEVQSRIKKYYGKESLIIYPGINFVYSKKETKKLIPNTDFFLVVSRLSKFASYKRVDLAIDACNELKLPLKVVGDGNLIKDLKKKAGPTIEFAGKVTDEELSEYYKNCRALLFPGNEDLGLVMVEAMRFGKPVIAFNGGGARELIVDGKTGLLFNMQKSESLIDALGRFENVAFDPKDSISQAQQFTMSEFKKKFLSVVNSFI